MSQDHYQIVVMFLSDALQRIGYWDVTVTNQYLDVMDDDDYWYAMNAM